MSAQQLRRRGELKTSLHPRAWKPTGSRWCGAYHGNECRVIEQRPTAVQHQFDDIVPMLSRFLDRANAVFVLLVSRVPRGAPARSS